MASVLIGAAAVSTAIAGGYAIYRYFTKSTATDVQHVELEDTKNEVLSGVELTAFTHKEETSSKPTSFNEDKEFTDSGNATEDSYEENDSPGKLHTLPQDDHEPSTLKSPPAVAPKPKTQASTKKAPPVVSPKPSPGRVGLNTMPLFPTSFASELEAKLKKRSEGAVEEQDGLVRVSRGTSAVGHEPAETAVSFEQPTKVPALKSPSRNKGPSNRRPPSRH